MTQGIQDVLQKSQSFEEAYQALIDYYQKLDTPLAQVVSEYISLKGKLVRPKLCLFACKMFGGTEAACVPAALALEMVHMYSLVHDDLPCMDDADTRRGRQTIHLKHSEAMAVLVGDALLSDAFYVLSTWPAPLMEPTRLYMAKELAGAIGSCGMVLGQVWDTCMDAKSEDYKRIYYYKTSSLFVASLVLGYLGAKGHKTYHDMSLLKKLGENVGIVYQLRDDLSDCAEDSQDSIVREVGMDTIQAEQHKYCDAALDLCLKLPNPEHWKDFLKTHIL